MVKNIIKLAMYAMLIIFCGGIHASFKGLNRAFSTSARSTSAQAIKQTGKSLISPSTNVAPVAAFTSGKSQITPAGSQFFKPQEFIKTRAPQIAQPLFEPVKNITPLPTQIISAPQPLNPPGFIETTAPQIKQQLFEPIKNISPLEQQEKNMPDIVSERLKNLKNKEYLGSLLAVALTSKETIQALQAILRQETDKARQTGYRIGFISPAAKNSRKILSDLIGKSLNDIPALIPEIITIDNVPWATIIILSDHSIVFSGRSINKIFGSFLISEPSFTSLLNSLDPIVPNKFTDAQGAEKLQEMIDAMQNLQKNIRTLQNNLSHYKALFADAQNTLDLSPEQIEEYQTQLSLIEQGKFNTIEETTFSIELFKELGQKIIQEKVLQQEVKTEYEAFEKDLAADQTLENEIIKLTEKLASIDAEIAQIEQDKEAAQQKIEQERKQREADAQQELKDLSNKATQDATKLVQRYADKKIQLQQKLNADLEQVDAQGASELAQLKTEQEITLQKTRDKLKAAIETANTQRAEELRQFEEQEKAAFKAFQEKTIEKNTLEREQIDLGNQKNKAKIAQLEEELASINAKTTQIKQDKKAAQQKFKQERKQREADTQQELENLNNKAAQDTAELAHHYADKKIELQQNLNVDLEQIDVQGASELAELKKQQKITLQETRDKLKAELETANAQRAEELKQLEAQETLKAKKAAQDLVQEKLLKLRKEAADKKAELEQANLKTEQIQKTVEEAGKNVVQAEEKKEDFKKAVEKLEQEIAQEKKQLSEKEQKKLLLEQEENEKKLKAKQAKLEQEVAEKEEVRLKEEKAAEEARIQEQAAKEAAEKAEKDLEDAIKQEQLRKEEEEKKRKEAEEEKLNIELPGGGDNQLPQDEEKEQEQIQKPEELPFPQASKEQPEQKLPITKLEEPPSEPRIETSPVLSEKVRPAALSEKIPKVGMQQPTEPPFQLPATLTQEPVFLSGQVPKTSIPQPIITPPFQVPSVATTEPVFLSGQTPKTRGEEPSPISIPAIEIKEPMIEKAEQALPESKPIKKPKPSVPEQAVAEPIEHPESHIKPLKPTTPEETSGSSGPVDMTPIIPKFGEGLPYPELEHKIYRPNLSKDVSTPTTTPPHSYAEMISSGSSEWVTPAQPETYQPAVKTPPAQVKPKKKKSFAEARVLFERLFTTKPSGDIKPEISKNKGISAWLRGLSLLQQKHAKDRKKPRFEEKETRAATKATTSRPNRVVSFIQNVTTVIKDTVNAVIDTIGSYINAFKNLF